MQHATEDNARYIARRLRELRDAAGRLDMGTGGDNEALCDIVAGLDDLTADADKVVKMAGKGATLHLHEREYPNRYAYWEAQDPEMPGARYRIQDRARFVSGSRFTDAERFHVLHIRPDDADQERGLDFHRMATVGRFPDLTAVLMALGYRGRFYPHSNSPGGHDRTDQTARDRDRIEASGPNDADELIAGSWDTEAARRWKAATRPTMSRRCYPAGA